MENKKIIGATPLEYDGIQFKSKLEAMCYKTLKERDIDPQYEQRQYTLFEGYFPSVPYYTKNDFKGKNHKISKISKSTAIDNRKVLSWVYTPDLYFEHGKYIIHIEVKGFYNDIARYKTKLFRWLLEKQQQDDPEHIYEFWEIHTKKQLLECIDHIKENC